jgi:hypothetical protein
MRTPQSAAAAEVAALLLAIQEADDEATDADIEWGDPNDQVAGFRFHAACARLHQLRDRLAALLHPGSSAVQ